MQNNINTLINKELKNLEYLIDEEYIHLRVEEESDDINKTIYETNLLLNKINDNMDMSDEEYEEEIQESSNDINNSKIMTLHNIIFGNCETYHKQYIIIHILKYNYAYFKSLDETNKSNYYNQLLHQEFEYCYQDIVSNPEFCYSLISTYFEILGNNNTTHIVEEVLSHEDEFPIVHSLEEEDCTIIIDYLERYIDDLYYFYYEFGYTEDQIMSTIVDIIYGNDYKGSLPFPLINKNTYIDFLSYKNIFQKKISIDAYYFLEVCSKTIGLTNEEFSLYQILSNLVINNNFKITESLTESHHKMLITSYMKVCKNIEQLKTNKRPTNAFKKVLAKNIKDYPLYTMNLYKK